jgi:hypothetical protein
VRADATYADKSAGAFSPRLGARYQLHSTFSLHGAVYKAFRAPNLAELYRKSVSSTHHHHPESEPRRRDSAGPRGRLRLAAARVDSGEGHVVRSRLQQLQRADEPHDDVGAAAPDRVRNGGDLPHASQRQQVAQPGR